jgi:hypothetical protein
MKAAKRDVRRLIGVLIGEDPQLHGDISRIDVFKTKKAAKEEWWAAPIRDLCVIDLSDPEAVERLVDKATNAVVGIYKTPEDRARAVLTALLGKLPKP